MKSTNYRYLEFISSFDDHSGGKESLTKVTSSISEKGRSYRRLNFFSERDLQVLETISRGEYITFGMRGKGVHQHLENISSSAMSKIFKRLRLHGIIERAQGTYKYFATAYEKEIIAAELTIKKSYTYTNIGIGIFLTQKFCHFASKKLISGLKRFLSKSPPGVPQRRTVRLEFKKR